MIKAGTKFEVTLDRQFDFYGREVTFPVQLSFKPGPNETIIVEADEDGRFDARIEGKKMAQNRNMPSTNICAPRPG